MAENLDISTGSISTMAGGGAASSDAESDNDQEVMSSSMASSVMEEIPDHEKIRAYAETILYMANRKEARRGEGGATNAASTNPAADHHPAINDDENRRDITGDDSPGRFDGGITGGVIVDENAYDHYDDAELEEFARLSSPKVSELLKEQALALDGILMYTASAWSDDDDDSDDDSSGGGGGGGGSHVDADQNLKDELDAAAYDFSKMWNDEKSRDDDGDDDDYEVLGRVDGDSQKIVGGAVCGAAESSKCTETNDGGWSSSIHEYYTENQPSSEGDHRPYSLSDHARTLHISRGESKSGAYTRPFLSRNDLQTSNIVTMPNFVIRPQGEVPSRMREETLRRILECNVEYIEPLKSRTIRRLFSGWNPGPGERKSDEDVGGGANVANNRGIVGGGMVDDSQRVMPCTPSKHSPKNDGDSSVEGEDGDFVFEDIGGITYGLPSQHVREPLPARTVTVRIRCDVMCGAVMDSLATSVERLGGEMTKRQGGHLRAVLPGTKIRVWMPGEGGKENGEENSSESISDDVSVASGLTSILSPILGMRQKGPTFDVLPPYILDAQLVTTKACKECQRLVLIRIFRMQDVARARSRMGEVDIKEELDVIAPLSSPSVGEIVDGVDASDGEGKNKRIADHRLECLQSLKSLQEAASLVQQIKALGGSGFAIDHPMREGDDEIRHTNSTKRYLKSFGDAIASPIRYFGGIVEEKQSSSSSYPTVMELMSAHLIKNYTHSPSVGVSSKSALDAAMRKSKGLFPALSKEDEPYLKSSWMLLSDCIEELDRRCLAYSTLGMYTAFQYPALPTLDGHFISQIKALCRENMIVSLVKTASDLEIYAREAEISCGNVDQLLRPTFDMYRMTPPKLPMPVPLTAYPLDFRAPEEVSPPWGPEVTAALDRIDRIGENAQNQFTSFERSEKAVSIVVAAFQRQNDVEQGARLGRKNLQVMDRLAKMQAHKRDSMAIIRGCYGRNPLATKAADVFHSLRKRSSNVGSLADVMDSAPDEVPLLICNVLVGNSAGTCYVTHSHVLFNAQLLPVLGGGKVHLFSIMDVDVTINAASKSMLSPLPASISFTTAVFGRKSTTREEVYNFIPSIGARRFAKFLEVLRDAALEDPNSLKFSERGGLIYLAD